MKLNLNKTIILAVLGTAASLPSLFGSMLTPDNTVDAEILAFNTGGTVIASTGLINVNPIPGSSFNATYQELVVQGGGNVFCADCLDFLIFATNAGPGLFERISTSSFGDYLTNVGFSDLTGGITPATVNRSSDGNVIGFNFISPGASVAAGDQTRILIIQTNATSFQSGLVSVQDGSSGFGAGYAPAPEPMSMVLFGTGLLAMGLSKKFLRGRKNAA